jgi:hypothetical protein
MEPITSFPQIVGVLGRKKIVKKVDNLFSNEAPSKPNPKIKLSKWFVNTKYR